MARLLGGAGERIELLALIDPALHPACFPWHARLWFGFTRPFRYTRYLVGDPRPRAKLVARNLRLRLAGDAVERSAASSMLTPRFAELERIGWEALAAYRPLSYDGTVDLFVAGTRYPGVWNTTPAWRRRVRRLTATRIRGDHGSIVSVPGPLAARLSVMLRGER